MEIANYTHALICTPKEFHANLPSHGFDVAHLETQSSLSCKHVEYAKRHIKPRFLVQIVGGMFDIALVRRILLGHNKSFVVANVDRDPGG
jgi:hypothetical protein